MAATEGLVTGFGAGDLFHILRGGPPRTRSELVEMTGFARSTVSLRIDELLGSGLISPVSSAASTGGRPSARVAMNPTARLVAAADFGATHATVAVMDLAGVVLASHTESRDIAAGPVSSLSWLTERIGLLFSEVDRSTDDLLAIGIGLPGPVEHATGRPTSPPIMPGWDGFDVPAHVSRIFPVPVLVDNDVNVMALGERHRAWPEVDNMIFVKVSTGIGAGIISDGSLQRGETGSAGDIGHIRVARAADLLCRCGNTGCLEAIAGAPAIVAQLHATGHDVDSVDTLMAAARTGDLAAMHVVRQAGRDIGEVLNMCVSIINPSVIVVGGGLSETSELLIAGIRESVYARSMPLATQDLTIAASRVGSDAGAIGAGMMAIDFALSPERITAWPRTPRMRGVPCP